MIALRRIPLWDARAIGREVSSVMKNWDWS